jgi:hypothetical protein
MHHIHTVHTYTYAHTRNASLKQAPSKQVAVQLMAGMTRHATSQLTLPARAWLRLLALQDAHTLKIACAARLTGVEIAGDEDPEVLLSQLGMQAMQQELQRTLPALKVCAHESHKQTSANHDFITPKRPNIEAVHRMT